jgi:cytochrome c oxidase assembly protein subunit 11
MTAGGADGEMSAGQDMGGGGRQRRHTRVALAATLGAGTMLGAAYAAVPIYRLICQVTGLGGTTQKAERPSGEVLERTIRVRFNGTVASGLPWDFKPVETIADVRIGETVLAYYRAANLAARATKGTATFNVTPEIAGRYFMKIECFCFTEQTLEPGQQVDMPVTFFVDPALAKDPDTAHLQEITLSYSFFAVDEKRGSVAERGAGEKSAPPAGSGGKGS